jgi:hypothetical protein
MTAPMQNAQRKLQHLLDEHESTSGMYVRIHGQHLILGREEFDGSNNNYQRDDRVRLTCLNARRYGLSVKRHTGRWERTPFSGTIDEMVQTILDCMQHLVADH